MPEPSELFREYGPNGIAFALLAYAAVALFFGWASNEGDEFKLGPAKVLSDPRKRFLIAISGVVALIFAAAAFLYGAASQPKPPLTAVRAPQVRERRTPSPRPTVAVTATPLIVRIYVTPTPDDDDRRVQVEHGFVTSWVSRSAAKATHYFTNGTRTDITFQLSLSDCVNVASCASYSSSVQPGTTVAMAVVQSDDGRAPQYRYDVFARSESLAECMNGLQSMLIPPEARSDSERIQRVQADEAEQKNKFMTAVA